jgi:tetratricopeptide (TPR) repeat protein
VGGTNVTVVHPDRARVLFFGVPSLPAPLKGREELIERIVNRLTARTRVLAVEGAAGIGKTTLAAAVAHHPTILSQFSDGVLWAGMGPHPDVESSLNKWAGALGISVASLPIHDRAAAIQNEIGLRRILLVIDDVWQEETAQTLLCGGPFCTHLLTMRDVALAWRLAGANHVESALPLSETASYDLLREQAPAACAADPELSRALAQAVGGLPLALQVLARHLSAPERAHLAETASAALAELSNANHRIALAAKRLASLDVPLGNAPPHTVRTIVEMSLEGLAVPVANAFYALGAFAPHPATFDQAAAIFVTGADPEALSQLVNRRLVENRGDGLSLHQVVADVARSRLPTTATSRHLAHYLEGIRAGGDHWRRIEQIYPQLKWAWDQLPSSEQETKLRIVAAVGRYQRLRGLWTDLARWGEDALAHAPKDRPTSTLLGVLFELGWGYHQMKAGDKALAMYRRCLAVAEAMDDRAMMAAVLNNMGMTRCEASSEEALEFFEQARTIREEVDDPYGMAITLSNIAAVYEQLGRREEALAQYQRLLPVLEARAATIELGVTLNNVGLLYVNLGDRAKGIEQYERAVTILESGGDLFNLAIAFNNLGDVHKQLGKLEDALRYHREALEIRTRIHDDDGCRRSLRLLAGVFRLLGDDERAEEYLARSHSATLEVESRVA